MRNNIVKVLALDTNCDAVHFITEDSSYYNDAAHFMRERLLNPHDEIYEVRMIERNLLSNEDERAFYLLYYKNVTPSSSEYKTAFDILWGIAEKDFFYV